MDKCEVCGRKATQLAHRIPQTKRNLEVYGTRVIHHAYNLAPACSLECNSAVSISNHPVECSRLLVRIYDALRQQEDV